jgi:poly-gamma-glutamate synthesis protein (capsule biosynthesis protein)
MKQLKQSFGLIILASLLLASCASPASASMSDATATTAPTVAAATEIPPTPTEIPPALWIAPSVPEALRSATLEWGVGTVEAREAANVIIDVAAGDAPNASSWVYALVGPFPTVADGVTFEQLKQAWAGSQPEAFSGRPLMMSESTYSAMKALFNGEAANGAVKILNETLITDALWAQAPSWGVVPFESLNPRLKVLEIDGQAPTRKQFDVEQYPLKVMFGVSGGNFALPATNRDPAKMATVVMTGVTALVRATAVKMEEIGVTYPGLGIRDWLVEADIAHISNEIPFAENCPYPNSEQMRLIFCSNPKYIELLEDVGMDVVELTGNHFEDWGKDATRYTVQMYKDRNIPYFGGGADLADAQKPAILEVNGMKFAFIGCTPSGPEFAWARADNYPGAAPCGKDWPGKGKDQHGYEWMVDEIKRLKSEGYIVIATFQYFEYYSPDPRPWQVEDFRRMAEAGAVVVSGSQAHYAQAMEFYNGTFIHYGLGNLFFDQMGYDNPSNGIRTTNTRREFLDRHVFYDGKLISTELLTAMLYDYAQPRPMTPDERAAFLTEYFEASGWK